MKNTFSLKRVVHALLLLCLFANAAAMKNNDGPFLNRVLDQQSPMPPNIHRISELHWLTGTWQGHQGESWMEETFTAPVGDMLLETSRFVDSNKTTFFEFTRMVEKDGSIELIPMPNGKESAPFHATECRENHITFENPALEFPRFITYELADANTLVTRVQGSKHGEQVSREFRYERRL
jgi:hypothetical protein